MLLNMVIFLSIFVYATKNPESFVSLGFFHLRSSWLSWTEMVLNKYFLDSHLYVSHIDFINWSGVCWLEDGGRVSHFSITCCNHLKYMLSKMIKHIYLDFIFSTREEVLKGKWPFIGGQILLLLSVCSFIFNKVGSNEGVWHWPWKLDPVFLKVRCMSGIQEELEQIYEYRKCTLYLTPSELAELGRKFLQAKQKITINTNLRASVSRIQEINIGSQNKQFCTLILML